MEGAQNLSTGERGKHIQVSAERLDFGKMTRSYRPAALMSVSCEIGKNANQRWCAIA